MPKATKCAPPGHIRGEIVAHNGAPSSRENLMTKSIVVLAVLHQFQGSGFQDYIRNPVYELTVRELIERGKIDFVFEEGAGREPSIAKHLVEQIRGSGHYMDISPKLSEEEKRSAMQKPAPKPLTLGCESAIVEEQRGREAGWLQRVENQPFENGLLICGACHNLSIAFRLVSAGIRVDRTYALLSCEKLAEYE
jgi:hypothetical protein